MAKCNAKTKSGKRCEGNATANGECPMHRDRIKSENSLAKVLRRAGAPQMNGEHAMTLEATWKGPCPADFKPGDMELPGGMKINMLTMGARGPAPSGGQPSAEQVAAMRKMIEAQKKAAQ